MLTDPTSIPDWFWEIMDKANKNGNTLVDILDTLPAKKLLAFIRLFHFAAIVLKDEPYYPYMNASDDGTEDLVRWVVSQGKEYYLNVWQHPEAMPPYNGRMEAEGLCGIAEAIYEAKFDDLPDDYDDPDAYDYDDAL